MERTAKKKQIRNKSIEKKFSFWFLNKKDKHFSLSKAELIEKYLIWLNSKEIEWIQFNSIGNILPRIFIYKKEAGGFGLNSSMNRNEYDEVAGFLKTEQHNFLENLPLK
jgi:hypothetical protein